ESEFVDGPLPVPHAVRGTLEVRDLRFAFADKEVLHGVSFRVEQGHSVAIVGPVAGGKSTVAQLVARVLPTPRGTVFLDGIDVCDLPVDFIRRTVRYAQQEAFLFSTTVYQNIALGLSDLERDQIRLRVQEAAKDVRMLDVL